MRRWAASLMAAWLGLGCAAGATGDTSGRERPEQNSSATGLGGGGMGGTSDGDGSGSDEFGNSMAPAPPADTFTEVDPGADDCQPGERCYSTDPDPEDCGTLTLEAEVERIERPGNVLLVFDRSQSMSEDWNGQMRWQAAGEAIRNALMPMADRLTAGAVFFPSADPDPNGMPACVDPTGIACIFVPGLTVEGLTSGCYVSPIDAADQVDFLSGPEFLNALSGTGGAGPLHSPINLGFTPLREGLQQAEAALDAAQLTGITSVIVITDGEPNCEWDPAVARQVVSDWQAEGINTHVIGLPGVNGMGGTVLNDLAQAGGTEQYITPSDASGLEQKLREIATETVQSGFDSCEIIIDPPAEAPEKLHLVVTEDGESRDVKRQLSDDASWNITDDGGLVELKGTLCEDATGGRFEELHFEFGCVDHPPLEPSKPD